MQMRGFNFTASVTPKNDWKQFNLNDENTMNKEKLNKRCELDDARARAKRILWLY